jgi:hypothetical protein
VRRAPADVRQAPFEAEAAPHTLTRPGKYPGVVLLLCQCCHDTPQIMAEVAHGKLIIKTRKGGWGGMHYVVLGPDVCERLADDRKICCVCCDPETEFVRVLAECRDGLLLIRTVRHTKGHFVALSPERLRLLLAPVP